MGINWIMEVLSYYAQDNADKWNIWFVADVGNLLQGVFIFVIFVCKTNVLVLLNRKIYPHKMFIRDTTPTRGCRTFSTTTITSSVRDTARGNAVNESSDRIAKIDSLEMANVSDCFDQSRDS